MDFVEARRRMVDGQLRPNRITDPRILDAMAEVPRERFVPAAFAARALADEDVALGRGRVLMQPMNLAKLVQAAGIRAGERVLVAAAGTGYGAAVIAHMGASVVAVEDDAELLALARDSLAALGTAAPRLESGDPAAGFPEAAPYDVILVEGAVPAVPPALSAQLAEGGRLVAIRREAHEAGTAVIGRRVGGGFSLAEAFDLRGVPLPAFRTKPGFVFS